MYKKKNTPGTPHYKDINYMDMVSDRSNYTITNLIYYFLKLGAFGFGGLGDGYLSAGRSRDALRAYQRALQLDPGNTELQTKIAAARAKP